MFGGFKASLNLFSGKNKKSLHSELSPDMTVSGAYRTSRDDFFGYRDSFDQTKKTTASEQAAQQMRPTKSTSDLTRVKNTTPNVRHSAVEVSRDPRGAEQVELRNGAQSQRATKNQEKEQKRLEKQRLAEHKARQKLIAQEQAKQEKLRREREKREAQQAKAKKRPDRKKAAPQPQATMPQAATPVVQASQQPPSQYPTNTLESSISRSSGPPPYSAAAPGPNRTPSQGESSGNVTFKKPEDTGSWDMISQHRQQTIRPTTTIGDGGKQNKQMVMDLNYNFGAPSQASQVNQDTGKENSDA